MELAFSNIWGKPTWDPYRIHKHLKKIIVLFKQILFTFQKQNQTKILDVNKIKITVYMIHDNILKNFKLHVCLDIIYIVKYIQNSDWVNIKAQRWKTTYKSLRRLYLIFRHQKHRRPMPNIITKKTTPTEIWTVFVTSSLSFLQ